MQKREKMRQLKSVTLSPIPLPLYGRDYLLELFLVLLILLQRFHTLYLRENYQKAYAVFL